MRIDIKTSIVTDFHLFLLHSYVAFNTELQDTLNTVPCLYKQPVSEATSNTKYVEILYTLDSHQFPFELFLVKSQQPFYYYKRFSKSADHYQPNTRNVHTIGEFNSEYEFVMLKDANSIPLVNFLPKINWEEQEMRQRRHLPMQMVLKGTK